MLVYFLIFDLSFLCRYIQFLKQTAAIFYFAIFFSFFIYYKFFSMKYTSMLYVHYFDAESSEIHKITSEKKQMAAILNLSFNFHSTHTVAQMWIHVKHVC